MLSYSIRFIFSMDTRPGFKPESSKADQYTYSRIYDGHQSQSWVDLVLQTSTNKTWECVILCPFYLESELVHEVDLVRVSDMAIFEVFNRHRKRGTEETNLPLSGAMVHQLLQHRLELWR